MQMNRHQKSIMKKRDQIIMSYVKKGMTYKQVAEIMSRHHKIKITYQRIGQIAQANDDGIEPGGIIFTKNLNIKRPDDIQE